MTTFLRLLADKEKANKLLASCCALRAGESDARVFQVAPESFRAVPGAPFAYWVSEEIRGLFKTLSALKSQDREICVGLQTGDDFRFVRGWWEVGDEDEWPVFAKGGAYSPYYTDHYLVVNWRRDGSEVSEFKGSVIRNASYYRRAGLTWGDRTSSFLSVKAWPANGVFSVKGSAGFFPTEDIFYVMALMNSLAFNAFLEMLVNAGSAVSRSYQVGVISLVPYANTPLSEAIGTLARRAWSLKRSLDTIEETSHAFALPAVLRGRLGDYNLPAIESELAHIQAEIDTRAFDLYGFSEVDRQAATAQNTGELASDEANEDEDAEETEPEAPPIDALLSWAVGVAFGHFDWRLATGERAAPPEPNPFDPLLTKSPGMLPDGAEPFHTHAGILLDDPGHHHDLAHLIEEVLARVNVTVPDDVCRWLQRDFFAFHLQRYSKSRRKAPIYWPLATSSGSYTLWLYYPSLNSQTLYTAINDFVEPKLKQVGDDLAVLRNKGTARTREDEKRFETLHAFELELIELRDTLLNIAPHYHPNHDDGVQITAAPLWPLFRHKPWQKVLKDTWAKLEKGDYDWAHLAMNYWPARVREKCRTDKSLAIAHGLEALYIEPEAKPKKMRGMKKADE